MIEEEQIADNQQISAQLESLSQSELQKRGIVLAGLKITGIKSALGGNTYFQFESGIGGKDCLSNNKFGVGDVVQIEAHSIKPKQPNSGFSGVVTKVSDTVITVSVKGDVPNDLPDLVKLYKLANTVSYKRMVYAMNDLKESAPSDLVKTLFGEKDPLLGFEEISDSEFLEESLNDAQKDAVRFAVGSADIALIHGPPGTGKSHTCIEIIRQLIRKKQKILVCGPSNISVDNLVERLSKLKIDLVRIGHPARMLDSVVMHSLEYRLRHCEEGQIVNDVRNELDSNLQALSKCKRKADRHTIYQNNKYLKSELKNREKVVISSILNNAQVILSTLNGAASHILKGMSFDVVLIDEASQALEAECWIAINKCKKLILAGDHLQLPPTIKVETATAKLLGLTLFERLIKLHGDSIKRLLNVQYRMNEKIMRFSSDYFYNGKLVCGDEVGSRLLVDLNNVEANDETEFPVVFIDTAGFDFEETKDEEDSKQNEGEAKALVEYIKALIDAGLTQEAIACISPYNAQVKLLKALIQGEFPGIELGTVDGFQGREKEAVLISLVRSNSIGEVGFLAEERRLNVALTRPKRHLCVIGNSETLNRNPFLKKLVIYLEEVAELRHPL